MRILIIGGTGLISTAITGQLVTAGHDVACLTRGNREARVPPDVTFVTGDRHDDAALVEARDETQPDCVIDMVCYDADTAERAVGVFAGATDQYVFTSTVDVYHRPPETQPITEGFPRDPPVSNYAANKAAAEDVFMDAHARGAFETTVIRPWSTYGEGGPVLHSLGTDTAYLDRIRRGKPVIQHADGQGLWGPCHRSDVARAYVGAVGNERAYGEAYHVTSEQVITWNQYHAIVAEALDAPDPDLVYIPTDLLRSIAPDRTTMLRDHFRFSTVFDNTKARRDLDYDYTVPFAEGVGTTIDWLRDHDAIEPWDSRDDDAIIAAWRKAISRFEGAAADSR